jgi:hypothetical protein
MKRFFLLLLVSLLLIGTVSAVTIGSSTPHATIVTPTLTVTAPVQVSIVSTPSGAAITVDGAAAGTLTPSTLSLKPGAHSFALSLHGYQQYTTSVTLTNGMAPQTVTADLRKLDVVTATTMMTLTPPVPHQATPGPMGTVPTRVTYPGALIEILSGNETRSDSPTPTRAPDSATQLADTGSEGVRPTPAMTLVVTTTTTPWACPNSDWSCLTTAEAQAQFGYPNARYGDAPCGYTQAPVVAKYCYMDVNSGGNLPSAALTATGINNGDRVYILNETFVVEKVVKTGVKKEIANAAPWQGVFDFLSGILSGSAKPESRLDIVGFNPQPEPPGKGQAGTGQQ